MFNFTRIFLFAVDQRGKIPSVCVCVCVSVCLSVCVSVCTHLDLITYGTYRFET